MPLSHFPWVYLVSPPGPVVVVGLGFPCALAKEAALSQLKLDGRQDNPTGPGQLGGVEPSGEGRAGGSLGRDKLGLCWEIRTRLCWAREAENSQQEGWG